MIKRFVFFVGALGAILPLLAIGSDSTDLAVIVNKKTAVLGMTTRDLKGIFLGEKEAWPNGTKLIAIAPSLEHAETRSLLKEICGMNEPDYKKYFMQMNFQGKTVNAPHLVASPAQVRAAVAATPGAIGIVNLHDVDTSVNVISLDGVAPGSAGYKLELK
jgi:ABC-type phosphate transport system substrate-binding protein